MYVCACLRVCVCVCVRVCVSECESEKGRLVSCCHVVMCVSLRTPGAAAAGAQHGFTNGRNEEINGCARGRCGGTSFSPFSRPASPPYRCRAGSLPAWGVWTP